jgi:hypothetical protein
MKEVKEIYENSCFLRMGKNSVKKKEIVGVDVLGNPKGITLIALIITIIVMLILARSNNSSSCKWKTI